MRLNWAFPRSQRVLFARLLLAVWWSVALVGCSTFSDTVAESSLGKVLARLAVSHGVCAVAVAVVKAGRLDRTETASGCQRTFPLEPDAIFQAASLSKPVTGYVFSNLAIAIASDRNRSTDASFSTFGFAERRSTGTEPPAMDASLTSAPVSKNAKLSIANPSNRSLV